jgi:protein TonB
MTFVSSWTAGTQEPRALRRGLVLVLLAALSACGGGQESPQPTAAAPVAQPAAAPAATSAPDAPVSLDQLLKDARLAVSEDRLASPAGNNAIEYYLLVMAQEPNNAQAMQALVDIFPLAAGMAERMITQRNLDEAERVLGLLDRASPNSYTVGSIRTKLETARTTQQREQQREQQAQLAAQQAAAEAAQQAVAETAPSAAATPAPQPAAPQPSAAAPARTPEPVASAPAPAATPAPVPAAAAGDTRDARAVRTVQPAYPPEALRRRQEGWVEVEFTIGIDGRVRDVSVLRAQPLRVFDREAIRAMQQWTFEPALRDGQPVESRLRRRFEFQQ